MTNLSSIDPTPEPTLFGYTHASLKAAMVAGFSRGVESRRDLHRDTIAAASGDPTAAHRLATQELHDTRRAVQIAGGWGPAHLRGAHDLRELIEFTEIYARWQHANDVIDTAARTIDDCNVWTTARGSDEQLPPVDLPTFSQVDAISRAFYDDRAFYSPPAGVDQARATVRLEQLEAAASLTPRPPVSDITSLRQRGLDGLAAPTPNQTVSAAGSRHLARPTGLTVHDEEHSR